MPKPNYRFRLKTLLFLIVPVAACLTRFGIAYNSGRTERHAAQWVLEQNGHVVYDYEIAASEIHPERPPLPAPQRLIDLLGVEFFSDVRGINLDNKEIVTLDPLLELRDLKGLGIQIEIQPHVDLSVISKLESLDSLHIDFTGLTEAQCEQIELLRVALPKCEIVLGDNVTF